MKVKFLITSVCLLMGIFIAGIAAASPEINWSDLNPNLQGATLVNDKSKCAQCHVHYTTVFEKTRHNRALQATAGGSGCESCHGPASKHIESPSKETIFSFKKSEVTSAVKNSVCLGCHEKGIRMFWKGSTHDMANLACISCHYVMEKRSAKNLFINEDSKKACFQCHKERRAQLQRSSHMPLREGKMDCASCHNPHGGPGPSLLKTASVNETCYQCHAEKRGPMVWEHAPVRENCTNCHDPHGSNFQNLLKAKPPYLCQQCHSGSGHPGTIYSGTALPGSSGAPAKQQYGKGCINCHSQIHGSNHPSGARFQR